MAAAADCGREADLFHFKRFSVAHECSSMKVGTDAVLLGAWCDLTRARRVLDVGTGCGVIALMVAQRAGDTCRVEAIDIDPASVGEASANFARSPWAARLSARLADFNAFVPDCRYDCIVTNPPFFVEDVLPPDAVRSAARHTRSLTFTRLMSAAARCLAPGGTVALVTPATAGDAVVEAATFAGLHLWRATAVHPVQGVPAKRTLWQFSRSRRDIERGSLVIQDGERRYTAEYADLCRDFYLKF